MDKLLRAAIYIRVSTEEQFLNGLSLPAQKQALTDYALANGYEIVDYYADEGISARKPMRVRKELQRLLKDVQEDKIDRILVTKLDRWFRNIKDYQITQEILEKHHCCWKTIFESYDSSTANGQMVINIMLSVNQAECDRTSERIKAVFDYKRANGELISRRMVPYGYTVADGRPQKDPETRRIVEDAYKYYFSVYSVRGTVCHIRAKYGNQAPSDNIIERFFQNEKYAGRNGEDCSFCEPYITYEQFQQIQKTKSYHTGAGPGKRDYIFSSLIQCPVCQANYTGFCRKYQRRDGSQSIYVRYRCANKFSRHATGTPSEKHIEEYMLTWFRPAVTERCQIILKRKERRDCKTRRTCLNCWISVYHALDAKHRNIFWKSCVEKIYLNSETHRISGFRFL